MIKMDVPEWFGKLGSMTDIRIARKYDVDVTMVHYVRNALGIRPYRVIRSRLKQLLPPGERWNRYLRLRRQKIPKATWPYALGFQDTEIFSARDQMDEWLYCRRKGKRYNIRWPKKPENIKKLFNYRAKSKSIKFRQIPRGQASPGIADCDDLSFEPGDV
jgi:hypothetical protein